MRVSGNHKDIQQICALYNKGIGAEVCVNDFLAKTAGSLEEAGKRTIVFLKNTADFLKINEKKLSDYLVVSNNLRTLSLSLSLFYLA